jgi:2-octaprenyl-6-methoxyphenol hydroxylase
MERFDVAGQITVQHLGRNSIAVVGGGPAGLAASLALARAGADVTLIRKRGGNDNRTTALLGPSMAFLEELGIAEGLAGKTEPLVAMRIIDDTGALIKAPTLMFRSDELGLEAFGHNIANSDLVDVLERAISAEPAITLRDALAVGAEITTDRVRIELDDGPAVEARLVIASDGRHSKLRDLAGISVKAWTYPQTAVTLNLTHTAPHRGISTEFHTRTGPFTLVPMPGRRSSLVAVVSPDEAADMGAMSDSELSVELERRSHSILGKLTPAGPRGAWPLSGLTPERFASRRIVLVGEAGHVLPPIGAQGLNLGFRDGQTIAQLVAEALGSGDDIGSDNLLAAYSRARSGDVRTRISVVDIVNRTLLSPLLPADAFRAAGLGIAGLSGPIRRLVMRQGLGAGVVERA